MPIYEFKCQECGEEFEVLLKTKDEIASVCCKACGSKKVERLLSVVNSLLSGGNPKGPSGAPAVESHSCPTGTCTHFHLPGHQK